MIRDSQIFVSSRFSISSGEGNARLNLKTIRTNIAPNISTIVKYGGWVAASDDTDPWIQVDFIANAEITAIFTQGLDNNASWVAKYVVEFGYDEENLKNYSVNGQVKVSPPLKQAIKPY